MRAVWLIIVSALALGFSGYYLQNHIEYNYHEPNIQALLQQKLQKGTLDKEINEALDKEAFDEAASLMELADRFGIELNGTTKERFEAENSTTKKFIRNAESFIDGFISGKAKDSSAIAGAVTSDFTLYGDLRDIYKEGSHYINNQSYNKFILGISMVGVALSATTVITFGASGALKGAASVLKLAKRQKYLTKGFSKTLERRLAKSVDTKALKELHFGSLQELKKSSHIIAKSVHLKPLKPILKDMRTIQKNSSVADSLQLLKYVDNAKDLKAVAKVTKRYKGASRGIFKVLGKQAIRMVKGGIKWGSRLLVAAATFILAAFGLLFGIFSTLFVVKKLFTK